MLLDAILGRPDNLHLWEDELLAYAASIALMAKNKKEKPSVSPFDLAQRVTPLSALRARALLRRSFGDTADAAEVLDRLADLLRQLDDAPDEPARDDTADDPARAGTGQEGQRPRR